MLSSEVERLLQDVRKSIEKSDGNGVDYHHTVAMLKELQASLMFHIIQYLDCIVEVDRACILIFYFQGPQKFSWCLQQFLKNSQMSYDLLVY